MLCGVTATLGSNPSATAAAARPHWGRAVLLCLRGVWGGLVAPTDLRPSRGLPARSPSAPRASLGASSRSPARPRRPRGGLQSVGVSVCCLAWPRRPWASQPGPPVTAGALHASGAFVADVAGASACCSARTRRLEACQILSFACNSPETLSNHELTTLELQRFQTLLKLLPIELHARFGWRWCRRLPRVPRPGPVGQVARWCETIVAFARWCRCGVETVVAFAGEK